MKSILDPTFIYVPSHLTSVTATWLRFGWRPKESADPQRLDLRDYFAAQALPACYAQVCNYCESHGWPENWRDGITDDAYKMADSMLKTRGL